MSLSEDGPLACLYLAAEETDCDENVFTPAEGAVGLSKKDNASGCNSLGNDKAAEFQLVDDEVCFMEIALGITEHESRADCNIENTCEEGVVMQAKAVSNMPNLHGGRGYTEAPNPVQVSVAADFADPEEGGFRTEGASGADVFFDVATVQNNTHHDFVEHGEAVEFRAVDDEVSLMEIALGIEGHDKQVGIDEYDRCGDIFKPAEVVTGEGEDSIDAPNLMRLNMASDLAGAEQDKLRIRNVSERDVTDTSVEAQAPNSREVLERMDGTEVSLLENMDATEVSVLEKPTHSTGMICLSEHQGDTAGACVPLNGQSMIAAVVGELATEGQEQKMQNLESCSAYEVISDDDCIPSHSHGLDLDRQGGCSIDEGGSIEEVGSALGAVYFEIEIEVGHFGETRYREARAVAQANALESRMARLQEDVCCGRQLLGEFSEVKRGREMQGTFEIVSACTASCDGEIIPVQTLATESCEGIREFDSHARNAETCAAGDVDTSDGTIDTGCVAETRYDHARVAALARALESRMACLREDVCRDKHPRPDMCSVDGSDTDEEIRLKRPRTDDHTANCEPNISINHDSHVSTQSMTQWEAAFANKQLEGPREPGGVVDDEAEWYQTLNEIAQTENELAEAFDLSQEPSVEDELLEDSDNQSTIWVSDDENAAEFPNQL